jgi:uncharacterized protein (DUF983 family)
MATINEHLRRCLQLTCPSCGQSSIFQRPFQKRVGCLTCDMSFEREEGYFVGAVLANIIATELITLVLFFVALISQGRIDSWMQWTLVTLGMLLPLLFYHHSWSIWLLIDYCITGKGVGRMINNEE